MQLLQPQPEVGAEASEAPLVVLPPAGEVDVIVDSVHDVGAGPVDHAAVHEERSRGECRMDPIHAVFPVVAFEVSVVAVWRRRRNPSKKKNNNNKKKNTG